MNIKSIIVCNNRLSYRQLLDRIEYFETMGKLTREQRIRLLFLHNEVAERDWKGKHAHKVEHA